MTKSDDDLFSSAMDVIVFQTFYKLMGKTIDHYFPLNLHSLLILQVYFLV